MHQHHWQVSSVVLLLAVLAFVVGLVLALSVVAKSDDKVEYDRANTTRSTLILLVSVSLVLFGCNLIGLPLHMTSMSGIIIALGLLIDNGIIVVEDYKHRRSLGLSPEKAIRVTTKKDSKG